jgi:hypothetical protein
MIAAGSMPCSSRSKSRKEAQAARNSALNVSLRFPSISPCSKSGKVKITWK